MKRFFCLAFCCLLPGFHSFMFPGDIHSAGSPVLTLLFYNTENFFHPSDDPVPGDDEFTPEGERHWTFGRYRDKLNGIARIIYAAGEWGAPDITGLCEIENRDVLEDLVRHPLLSPSGLMILHSDGPDPRGIDIGVLYRPDRIRLLSRKRRPVIIDGKPVNTREIIQVTALLKSGDTLELFLNHWTSKYGGIAATDEKRMAIASQLAAVLDSLLTSSPGRLVLVAGDLNDNSASASVQLLTGGRAGGRLEEIVPSGAEGSYKYQGKWDLIDHVFAGGATDKFRFGAEFVHLPVLFEPDEKFNGIKPFRTYTGFTYNGGYSDHLPVLLRIYRAD